jgi:predicted DNA-binding transcriptional regulator AlpA
MLEKKAYSIQEFCKVYGFSKQHFYKMEKRGITPKILSFGRRRLITVEAINEWQTNLR